jgi:hypothetical protein
MSASTTPQGHPNRRDEIILALAIFMWMAVAAVAWLAYSYWHGFDPELCRSYGGCQWTA